MAQPTVAIIGAGQAGLQLAAALREKQHAGRIVLIGEELQAPYQRPPLSKNYLLGECSDAQVLLRPEAFYGEQRIELITGQRVVAIDRDRRRVELEGAASLAYDHLVLATGARNRLLSVPGVQLRNVCYLRTLDDAARLRARLDSAKHAVVIGAGFIGLEFAATAAGRGISVTVLDVAARPMARAVSQAMAAIFAREHSQHGVRLLFNVHVSKILETDGAVSGVALSDATTLPADLLVIGVGVIPNMELAAACGLPVGNGVIVDEWLQTSDQHISAIGDVADYPSPYAQGRVRLESVQNACDQARCVAARIVGAAHPYTALPWFWSHQGTLKLQMAGLPAPGCQEVVRGDPQGVACSVFLFRAETLLCVESLNRPAEHVLARRLLTQRVSMTLEQAADTSFDLKSLLSKPVSA